MAKKKRAKPISSETPLPKTPQQLIVDCFLLLPKEEQWKVMFALARHSEQNAIREYFEYLERQIDRTSEVYGQLLIDQHQKAKSGPRKGKFKVLDRRKFVKDLREKGLGLDEILENHREDLMRLNKGKMPKVSTVSGDYYDKKV
jgi:hypothetical protein